MPIKYWFPLTKQKVMHQCQAKQAFYCSSEWKHLMLGWSTHSFQTHTSRAGTACLLSCEGIRTWWHLQASSSGSVRQSPSWGQAKTSLLKSWLWNGNTHTCIGKHSTNIKQHQLTCHVLLPQVIYMKDLRLPLSNGSFLGDRESITPYEPHLAQEVALKVNNMLPWGLQRKYSI